jgi:hypothetical protein
MCGTFLIRVLLIRKELRNMRPQGREEISYRVPEKAGGSLRTWNGNEGWKDREDIIKWISDNLNCKFMPVNVGDMTKEYATILHTTNWHYSHLWAGRTARGCCLCWTQYWCLMAAVTCTTGQLLVSALGFRGLNDHIYSHLQSTDC